MERKPQFSSTGVKHATINGHRFHLRTLDAGADNNFLWIDGRQPPLVLDEVAAQFVSYLIDAMWMYQQGDGDESQKVIDYVIREIYKLHGRVLTFKDRVTKGRITADFHRIFGTLMGIAEGKCPAEMGINPREISYTDWSAPARMDLAVTYRCNLFCDKCYLGGGDKFRGSELTLEDWRNVYKKLWKIGIPQVVFTGGEPTMRPDIVELVSEADEFVTGLITNGTKLVELAEPLKAASLDYVQITIESRDHVIHNAMTKVPGSHTKTTAGISAALKAGLQVVTNTTLTTQNAQGFCDTIRWLGELGVKNIACNTIICAGRGTCYKTERGLDDELLCAILRVAIGVAERLGVNLQWYSPTCYNLGVNPLDLGFGIKACSAAAHNMMIGPDGSVFPCQSWHDPVGNILSNTWNDIWNHGVCRRLRNKERPYVPNECTECEFLETCGGGCPLDKSKRNCGVVQL